MNDLTGKVSVITGGGRGIGRAISVGFAKAGSHVCCSGRGEAEIAKTAAEINRHGGKAIATACDVTNQASVEALFRSAADSFGKIDIVVANAGIETETKTVEDSDPDEWRSIIETNLMGSYYTARAAIPYLRETSGKLIFLGSHMGHRGGAKKSAYSCSKAGLWMLVRVLAQELAPLGICVNELIPGPVDTDMMRANHSRETSQLSQQFFELEWLKNPEDVVPLALFLASSPTKGPTAQSFSLARREA